MADHSNRAHALLAPSAAHRWLNCTPSARLEEAHGKNTTSKYAEEGTIAHELCEVRLRMAAGLPVPEGEEERVLEKAVAKGFYSDEMEEAAKSYVETCMALIEEVKAGHSMFDLFTETRVSLAKHVPEAFGSIDFLVAADDIIYIVDFKYGKGVPVAAENNRQMMLYAVGAVNKLDTSYDIKRIAMLIVQPRLGNIDRFDMASEELRRWAEGELTEKALLAFHGGGEMKAGSWCQFCGVRQRCRALYEEQMRIAAYEFREPELLSDGEIVDVLHRENEFTKWLNSVREYVYGKLLKGESVEGVKLVAGRRTRAWSADEAAIAKALSDRLHLSDDDIYVKRLASLTAVEKTVGKKAFAEAMGDCVSYKNGRPIIADADDKREAFVRSADDDFSEYLE